MRPERLIVVALVCSALLHGAALAQTEVVPSPTIPSPKSMALEPDPRAAVDRAAELGFYLLHQRDLHDSAERERLDREIVGPLVRAIAPDRPYGFIFDEVDIDGDHRLDAVITLKMAGLVPKEGGVGAVTVVYLQRDNGWKLALEGSSMQVGIRQALSGALDVAFVQEHGVKVYSWNGSELVAP